MKILQGLDGNWYAVWDQPNMGWDNHHFFPGSRVSCFGQLDNALQLTFND